MKKLIFFLFVSTQVFAQNKVDGDIHTKDTAKLSILGVYQDQFPNVSVVFRAEKLNGDPVFGLQINDMKVSENGEQCKVISLQELTKKKPINIGIVLDHSGSMLYDGQQLLNLGVDPWFMDFDTSGMPIFPKAYKAPIAIAKEALINFVSSFNFKKDQIGVVGFSSQVDKVLSLSKDKNAITSIINSMEADSMTAFYDALLAGLDQVKESDGLGVLVALTDGNDNMSTKNFDDVINYAKEVEIPIYLVGLGDVNVDSLKMLAEATDGQFFYANSATALKEIYDKISTKLQAFYDLTYVSPNLSADGEDRTLEISFNREGIHLITEEERFKIDKNVIEYIKQKEAEKEREYFIYGGVALVVLIAGGLVFYFSRRKSKPKLKIVRVFPNPTSGNITLTIENNQSEEGTVTIFDRSGSQVFQEAINSSLQINLESLPYGLYTLNVSFDGDTSEAVKVFKK